MQPMPMQTTPEHAAQQPPMHAMNATAHAPPHARAGAIPPMLKLAYVGAFVFAVALPALNVFSMWILHAMRVYSAWAAARQFFPIVAFLGVVAWIAMLGVALSWLYAAWSAIPMHLRRTKSGQAVSPGAAVGMLFIPVFNIYWAFVVTTALCDVIDAALDARGHVVRTPRTLAILAIVAPVVPIVGLFAPLLWFGFMRGVERAFAQAFA